MLLIIAAGVLAGLAGALLKCNLDIRYPRPRPQSATPPPRKEPPAAAARGWRIMYRDTLTGKGEEWASGYPTPAEATEVALNLQWLYGGQKEFWIVGRADPPEPSPEPSPEPRRRPIETRFGAAYHVVERGETLASVATLYGCPVDTVLRYNEPAIRAEMRRHQDTWTEPGVMPELTLLPGMTLAIPESEMGNPDAAE